MKRLSLPRIQCVWWAWNKQYISCLNHFSYSFGKIIVFAWQSRCMKIATRNALEWFLNETHFATVTVNRIDSIIKNKQKLMQTQNHFQGPSSICNFFSHFCYGVSTFRFLPLFHCINYYDCLNLSRFKFPSQKYENTKPTIFVNCTASGKTFKYFIGLVSVEIHHAFFTSSKANHNTQNTLCDTAKNQKIKRKRFSQKIKK